MEKYDTILIACENAQSRGHIRFILQERFNLLEARNLQQAMALLEQNADCIAAVVFATSALGEKAIQSVRNQQTDALLSRFPVIVLTEEENPGGLSVFYHWGAAEVIAMRNHPHTILRRIETITQLHIHRQHLQQVMQEQADRLRRANEDMVDVLTSIIEYRSMESGHHIRRIRNFTRILLEEVMRHCPEYQITDRAAAIISSASALHDIGKIAIPDSILQKPGPLTPVQWDIMKTHTTTGCQILDTLGNMSDREYLRYAHNICHYHHERWDGGGYPEGLAGDEIPICAQVVGLADAYEALTSKRVYKEACTFDQAVNMILQGDCGVFSPKLLECFKSASVPMEALTREYADGKDAAEPVFDMTLPAPLEEREDTLERTRAKYYALVHYVGALLVEINLDRQLFHVVYNPYPEIARLEGITTLTQLYGYVLDKVVVPAERERMHQMLYETIPEFVRKDLRRTSYQFHYQVNGSEEGGLFEVTLLRIEAPKRHSLALLCRRLEDVSYVGDSFERVMSQSLQDSAYICRNDRDFTLAQVGWNVHSLAGYPIEEIYQRFGGRLSELIHPEDRELVRQARLEQLRHGAIMRLEHRIVAKDGSVKWVTNKSRLFQGEDGQEYLYSILLEITDTREENTRLQKRIQLYSDVLVQTETVLFNWDVIQDRMSISDSWKKSFRFTPRTERVYFWLTQCTHIHPDDIPRLLDKISDMHSGADAESVELRISSQGSYVWYRIQGRAVRDEEGRLTNILGVLINVEQEKKAEDLLKEQADRDALTKLLNKSAGRKRIETYLSYYAQGVSCAMIIIDLDNFKQVNDQYGHLFGDAVLTKVAQELRERFEEHDIVSRIGGDEFLVLVRGGADRPLLESTCRKLISAIRGCLRAQNKKLAMGCSVGIALAPEHGTTYHELFNHADQALYQAKANGKNGFCFYAPTDAGFPEQLVSRTAVGASIDSDERPGLAEDNIIRHAFQLLYSSDDLDHSVNRVLSFLGTQMNVSRVYVFENSPDNKYCSNTFEWCNQGIQPEIQNLQQISYETDIPDYEDNFNEQGIFYCPDIALLPRKTYDIVAPQGIKSMLHCAIRQDGVFRGYIGFDECVEQRLWTKEEISLLSYFSQTLALFLLKRREQQRLQQQSDEMQLLLNNQNACIYIIDPESWEMKYCNDQSYQKIAAAEPGAPCYRYLMNRSQPCPGCPVKNIREKGTDRVILRDEKYGTRVLAEATMIRWHGQESCLMSSRVLPPE